MPTKLVLAVALAAGACTTPATAQSSDSLPALQATIEQLQSRLDRMKAIHAVERLQYAYGHYVELGLWNDFADLFADNAHTNYQQGANDKEAIRKLFFDQVGQGKLGLADGRIYPHILFQPVVTLAPDGRSAKGRWRILAMLGGLGGSATWYSGVYENEYRLEDGVWKISLIHSDPKATAAYTAAGWKASGVHTPLHFDAAGVTTQSPPAIIPASARRATLASLGSRVADLAQRAVHLNDQAEVTNLQNTYGYAVDRKQWNQAADLFVPGGTLELGLRGVYVGKASIRHALDQFGPQGLREGERNDHVMLETIVTVAPDGRTAKARADEFILSSEPGAQGGAELTEGVFENTFVKQGRTWKIQSVHFYPRLIVDAAKGWARSAKPAPGPNAQFPPDRPPTASYEIYPKFAVAPFHFNNPATGKPPQYPAAVIGGEETASKASTVAAATPAAPAIPNAAALKAAVAELERAVAQAEAYDAAENMIDAYAYYLDDSPGDASALFSQAAAPPTLAAEGTVFVNQMLQPVIDVAPDGKSTRIRARWWNLNGTSGGPGFWTAGEFEARIAEQRSVWKFQSADSTPQWSGRYPGGWARTP